MHPRFLSILGALYYFGLAIPVDRIKAENLFYDGLASSDLVSGLYLAVMWAYGHTHKQSREDGLSKRVEAMMHQAIAELKLRPIGGKQDGELCWLFGAMAAKNLAGLDRRLTLDFYRKAAAEHFHPAYCR